MLNNKTYFIEEMSKQKQAKANLKQVIAVLQENVKNLEHEVHRYKTKFGSLENPVRKPDSYFLQLNSHQK